MKTLQILNLSPPEVPTVLELDQTCFGGLWSASGYLREITSPNSYLICLHFQANQFSPSQIIGVACLWEIVEEAHITLLGIEPAHRRQGLGELLLLALLDNAIARKLERATLEVSIDNNGARKLYQKFGFQVAGTRKGYYQKTGEDALILWRKGINEPDFALNLAEWQKNADERLKKNNYRLI